MSQSRKILHSSKTVEWFSPIEYVDAARRVMGKIDLDPASCKSANERIKAKKYFDSNKDGLKQKWSGKVFLNPPYGRTGQSDWSKKLIKEYQAGNVEEAIMLVNSATGNKWFQPLWEYPICFVSRRIKFVSADNVAKHSPTHSNAFVYFGKNEDKFVKEFSNFGAVVKRIS